MKAADLKSGCAGKIKLFEINIRENVTKIRKVKIVNLL